MRGYAGLMVACTGCFAHRPANELRADAPITVRFQRPTAVAVVGASGDSLWLREVTTLRGRVQRMTGDTVYLRGTVASTPTDVIRGIPDDHVATIARQPGVVLEQRELKPVRTGALVIGVAALLGVIALALAGPKWE